MTYFPAIVTGDAATGYTAIFPDVPGCSTSDFLLATLPNKAGNALISHLQKMIENDEPWPMPKTIDEALLEAAPQKPIWAFQIQVPRPDRAERVNLTIPAMDLQIIDRAAEKFGQNRSAFMVTSALERAKMLDKPPFLQNKSIIVIMSEKKNTDITSEYITSHGGTSYPFHVDIKATGNMEDVYADIQSLIDKKDISAVIVGSDIHSHQTNEVFAGYLLRLRAIIGEEKGMLMISPHRLHRADADVIRMAGGAKFAGLQGFTPGVDPVDQTRAALESVL